MRVIRAAEDGSPRDVELTTNLEEFAAGKFDDLLGRGHNIPSAAALALNMALAKYGTIAVAVDSTFVDWLSEGTVRRWGPRFLIKPECRT